MKLFVFENPLKEIKFAYLTLHAFVSDPMIPCEGHWNCAVNHFCAVKCATGKCGMYGRVPKDTVGKYCQPCLACKADALSFTGKCSDVCPVQISKWVYIRERMFVGIGSSQGLYWCLDLHLSIYTRFLLFTKRHYYCRDTRAYNIHNRRMH